MSGVLEGLVADLNVALAAADAEQVLALRRQIADGHPQTDAGAEASYRLGLQTLFAGQDVDTAVDLLRAAAKAKSTTWTPRARLALGLLLFRLGKVQQAVFEFRKVASAGRETLEAAQALGLIVMVQRESNKGAEAERTRADQLELLRKISASTDVAASSMAHFMLGFEHKFAGERKEAKAHLELAMTAGGLTASEIAQAEAAVREL